MKPGDKVEYDQGHPDYKSDVMGQHIGKQVGVVISVWTVEQGPKAGVEVCDVEFLGKFNGMIRSIAQDRFIQSNIQSLEGVH